MKIVLVVILSVVTEISCYGGDQGGGGGGDDKGPDPCLAEAEKKAKDYDRQAAHFCTAKLQVSESSQDKMRHKTGKTCKAKWDDDDNKGIDVDCNEYPAFCSQVKLPDDVMDQLTRVPVFALKPCFFSKLIKFKKEMTNTPLKCLVDIVLSLYMS